VLPYRDDYAYRHQRWLEKVGFRLGDPFAVYDADQETDVLHDLFVDRPYLARVTGDPARPQTAFLLAGRGAGKTATREMVAYECFHGYIHHRALPVRYTDFSPTLALAGGEPASVRAEHHIHVIARLTLRSLAEDVPATFFDILQDDERALLASYAARFADPAARYKLTQRLRVAPPPLDLEGLSAVETLAELARLVTRLGQSPQRRYEALYVLVDRVDESAAGPDGALPFLRPLVEEGALMIMPRVAFKFFLPLEVGQALTATVPVGTDKLPLEIVTWDEGNLSRLLCQRLAYYSESQIEDLEQICTPGARNATERLVQASQGSPRALLRLCAGVVRCHVSRTTKPYLEPQDITSAIEEFEHQVEVSRGLPRGVLLPSDEPPARGLFLDRSDHVWIDGELLTPPLSPLEFRLLRVLYSVAPNIVSQEQLIRSVLPESSQDEQNLRKLITRLRQRLEPEGREGAWRFVRNVRGRGYWLSRD
jgi:hypothetical protein